MTSLPAGSLAPIASLGSGDHELKIVQKEPDGDGNFYIYIEFPDGFRKTFQVLKITDLTAKLAANLKARYGIESLRFTRVSEKMDLGDIILINVQ